MVKLGDIVHYLGEEVHYAAIVGQVNEDGTLNLTVIPNGTYMQGIWNITNVPECDPELERDYTWHLPEE